VAAAKEKGVVVSNIPTFLVQTQWSQFAIALLLVKCAHNVGAHSESVFMGSGQVTLIGATGTIL
jgi:lactate dehydrogenase-like 2-hydroxyacid dehydrogenase